MPDSAPLPFALGPHAETAVAHVEISTAQAGGMMQGKPNTNLAYLAGVIFYFDQIDPTVRHETKFCYRIGPASSLVDTARPDYSFCGYWNCTDDECTVDRQRYRNEVTRAFRGRDQNVPECFYGFIPPVPPACAFKPPPDPSLRYLVEPSLAAAQARSAEQCKAMGCTPPSTEFWWDVKQLPDGTAAVVIQADGPYAAEHTIKGRTAGLSKAEIRSLKTARQLGHKLPPDDEALQAPSASATSGEKKERPWHFP
jgi:hypothetical protein